MLPMSEPRLKILPENPIVPIKKHHENISLFDACYNLLTAGRSDFSHYVLSRWTVRRTLTINVQPLVLVHPLVKGTPGDHLFFEEGRVNIGLNDICIRHAIERDH